MLRSEIHIQRFPSGRLTRGGGKQEIRGGASHLRLPVAVVRIRSEGGGREEACLARAERIVDVESVASGIEGVIEQLD